MTENEPVQPASEAAPESFQEELCRKGQDAASRLVAAREAAGVETPTLDDEAALGYLRPDDSAALEVKLLDEVNASDQPDIRVMVLNERQALMASGLDDPRAQHVVAELNFDPEAGNVRLWDIA